MFLHPLDAHAARPFRHPVLRVAPVLLTLLVATLASSPSARAQEEGIPLTAHPRFGRLTVEQGLPQSSAYAVAQDRQGFMWFGTEDGLTRYDGYQFTPYRPLRGDDQSLAAARITSLAVDRSGSLWIGTDGGGLDRFADGSFAHYRHAPEDPSSLADDHVSALLVDREGVLWVGSNQGLDALDPKTGRFRHYVVPLGSSPISARVNALFENREGLLWIGTDSGLATLAQGRALATLVPMPGLGVDEDRTAITAVLIDRQEDAWAGTRCEGLLRKAAGSSNWSRLRHNPLDPDSLSDNCVRFVAEDRSGTVWVGTENGLNRFEPATGHFVAYHAAPSELSGLSSDRVLAYFEDRAGVIWLGTHGGGLSKIDPFNQRFSLYRHNPVDPSSLADNRVTAFAEDESGAIWIGTDGGGLDRLDQAGEHFTHLTSASGEGLSDDRVSALLAGDEGTMWVGTMGGGLVRSELQTGRVVRFRHSPGNSDSIGSNDVSALFQDSAGRVWVGSPDNGLSVYTPQEARFVRYSPSESSRHGFTGSQVNDINEDGAGVVWVATGDAGVFGFDATQGRFSPYPPAGGDSLPGLPATVIHEDAAGSLWVGTLGAGLCRLSTETRALVCLTEQDGLPSSVIYGILEDESGSLWLSTNKGIVNYQPRDGSARTYTAADGLQSTEFTAGAYFRNSNGEMFFGGMNGFNAFNPRDVLRKNDFVPPVVLTSLTQGGDALSVGWTATGTGAVTLEWPHNFFEFEFAALSYTRPERNQYAYKLEGFGAEDWNFVGSRRFGRYTNLPGGVYTLRLKGSTSDGVWNDSGLAVRITVVPPFWQTSWFRTLGVLILATLVAGGVRWRFWGVEERNRRLELQVTQRTHEIEQRRQDLSALYMADERLYGHLELNNVLDTLVDITVGTLGAHCSAVLTRGIDGRLIACVGRGLPEEMLARLSHSPGQGIAGRVLATGQPAIVGNAGMELNGAAGEAEPMLPLVELGIRSLMQLPIRADDEIYGVYCVGYKHSHAFGQEEQRLYEALVQRAAMAIENAQLYAGARLTAASEERSRLARDLHDAVTQTLFSASLIAEALPKIWDVDPDEGRSLLAELRQLSRGALAEMRGLLMELRPAALSESMLPDLLRQLAEAASGRMGVPVTLVSDGRAVLPPDVHVALYRIAQEALNNVAKHARASSVQVSLHYGFDPDEARKLAWVELLVSDDGCGFIAAEVPPDHLGLGIMSERAEAVGAVAEIRSQPGSGTGVYVFWPRTRSNAAGDQPQPVSQANPTGVKARKGKT